MIPSSTCSSSDQVESAPANSLVTQPSYREVEEVEPKQTPKVWEKQVIVNNYYISDKENGWKQLREGEIPPNRSEVTSRRMSGEILPNETMQCQKKHRREDTNEQNSNIIRKTGPVETDTIEEVGRYYVEEAETQNMAPPPTHNFDYAPPVKPAGVLDTSSMLDCIRQFATYTTATHFNKQQTNRIPHVPECRSIHRDDKRTKQMRFGSSSYGHPNFYRTRTGKVLRLDQ